MEPLTVAQGSRMLGTARHDQCLSTILDAEAAYWWVQADLHQTVDRFIATAERVLAAVGCDKRPMGA